VIVLLVFGLEAAVFGHSIYDETYRFLPLTHPVGIFLTVALATAGARRLQDAGFPGWPALVVGGICLSLIAWDIARIGQPIQDGLHSLEIVFLVLAVLLLIAALLPSRPGPNKYGPNPHEVTP